MTIFGDNKCSGEILEDYTRTGAVLECLQAHVVSPLSS